jgi:hypothetical protein
MSARGHFKQADVTRASKGVKSAGLDFSCIQIDPSGSILIHINQPKTIGKATGWEDLEQTLSSPALLVNPKTGMAKKG